MTIVLGSASHAPRQYRVRHGTSVPGMVYDARRQLADLTGDDAVVPEHPLSFDPIHRRNIPGYAMSVPDIA
eukprot:92638-Rhodomonas_salina.2